MVITFRTMLIISAAAAFAVAGIIAFSGHDLMDVLGLIAAGLVALTLSLITP